MPVPVTAPLKCSKAFRWKCSRGKLSRSSARNGAGKTTTLMCISGINRLRAGNIKFNGREIQTLPPHEIVRLGLCQSPEGRKIFPRLTVLENLELGAISRRDAPAIRGDIDRMFALFPILQQRAKQQGGTLSGGEQQMLAVGRALMARPKLLLLDEPSLGLAPLVVAKIFDVIRQLNQESMSVLLVEQNALMALRVAHRGYVMETGAIALSGPAAELLNNQRVKDAYLGQ